MSLLLTSLLATLCYLIAGAHQIRSLSGQEREKRPLVMTLGGIAVVTHTFAVYLVLHTAEGIQLGLFPVGSLIAWLVAALVLLSSLRKPLHNLFVGVFPLAALATLAALVAPETSTPQPLDGGIISHILSSIAAYSIFAIAALQALLLAVQDRQLKHHHTRGVVKALPPLQVMEQLLFEILWAGMLLLSLSLVSGMIFVDDLFAQHLAHKTLLSLLAWSIFAILLWGRHQWGWRGQTAIRWTLCGFVLLMIAYFGSKAVLELLIR